MTLIQPNKENSFFNYILICLSISIACAVCTLVVFYGKTVDLNHALTKQTLSLQKLEAQSAEYKDAMFRSLQGNASASMVAERGLIQEKNPEYFEVSQQWTFASR